MTRSPPTCSPCSTTAAIDRAVLAGASMGAHTLIRLALDHPERAAALVVITPAFEPGRAITSSSAGTRCHAACARAASTALSRPTASRACRSQFRDTVRTVLRQRLSAHEHPEAVADALSAVPRSDPFGSWDELARLDLPVTVVASRDEADPGHPYAVGERYARDDPGRPAARPRSRASPRSPGREGSSRA